MEHLSYALSYNQEHIGANYLMGKLYQEQLSQYKEAEEYYITALASDPNDLNVCLVYISLLILLQEYKKAKGLISYAQKLKGIDLSKLKASKAIIHEHNQNYKKALLHAYHEESINEIQEDIKRVKMKRKLKNKFNQKAKKEVL